ncbi:MAG: type II toxin-antitoxin system VapC family toxin [Acidobacteriota bacterium]|nr:type II toxin-antitoxin system VapC family toxin [Acidobacteriota bacterium]
MTVLVDSDILIEVTRAKNAEVVRRWTELSESQYAVLCSPVSVAELWHGALPHEHEVLTNLFDALVCPPIDARTASRAGGLLQQLRKSHGLELGDALIAAAVILNDAELWTRNHKHYPMAEISFF